MAVMADTGKIATVVDVINQNRALVEGPGIPRQSMNIKNLYLTKLKVKFNHSAKSSIVKKAWEDAEVGSSSDTAFQTAFLDALRSFQKLHILAYILAH